MPEPSNVAEPLVELLRASDVGAVVNLHVASFPDFFLTQLGRPFLAEYYRSFLTDPGTIALVVRYCARGAVLGFAVGALNPSNFYRRLMARRWYVFGLAAIPAVLRDPRRLRRVLRGAGHPGRNPKDALTVGLFSIGVSPHAHGKGLGATLVDAFIEQAVGCGGRAIWLTTDADDNEAVNAFYQRLGFRVAGTFTTPEGRRMHEYYMSLAITE